MDPGGTFNFQNLPDFKFSCADNTNFKENILKWSMTDGLKLQAYSFDKPFKKYNESDFIVVRYLLNHLCIAYQLVN